MSFARSVKLIVPALAVWVTCGCVPAPTTGKRFTQVSESPPVAPRAISISEAKEFLNEVGFDGWESKETEDGTVTTGTHDVFEYRILTVDNKAVHLSVGGDDSPPERVGEVRRIAGILTQRVTGQPLPDSLAVGEPGPQTVRVGGWFAMTMRKKGIVIVSLGKAD